MIKAIELWKLLESAYDNAFKYGMSHSTKPCIEITNIFLGMAEKMDYESAEIMAALLNMCAIFLAVEDPRIIPRFISDLEKLIKIYRLDKT